MARTRNSWQSRVAWHHITPGKPQRNAFVESSSSVGRVTLDSGAAKLDERVFDSLGHARRLLAAWRQGYDHVRPHSAHAGLPPVTAGERLRDPDRLRRSPAPLAARDPLRRGRTPAMNEGARGSRSCFLLHYGFHSDALRPSGLEQQPAAGRQRSPISKPRVAPGSPPDSTDSFTSWYRSKGPKATPTVIRARSHLTLRWPINPGSGLPWVSPVGQARAAARANLWTPQARWRGNKS